MMWVRLDCTLASHRKILRVGAEAAWLWVCGLAHANQHTTNGVIHRDALVALYPSAEWTPARRRNLVAKLVEAGLWEVIDADSWMIHGYAEHQSEAMSEAVEARREREREKKRAQRNAGKSGGSHGVSPRDTQGDTQGSPSPVSPPPSPRVSPPSDRPTDRPSDGGETRASAEPTPSAHGPATTPTGRSMLDAFRDAAGGRATLVGNMSEERGLARMLDRLAPSTAEVQAMADALGSPAAWWPPGKRTAPKHVTLRDLAGWKEADGEPGWAPLSALIAHVRAEAARARREAEERAAAEAAARRAPPPEERPQITPEAQARMDEARRRVKAALWTYGDPPLDGAKQ